MVRKHLQPMAPGAPTKLQKSRWVWCETFLGTFAVARRKAEDRAQTFREEFLPEEGDDILLHVPQRNGGYTQVDLTKLTTQELDYVEAVLGRALQAARPIVERRDQIAKDAAAQGDDSYARNYRQVPGFFIREGSQ